MESFSYHETCQCDITGNYSLDTFMLYWRDISLNDRIPLLCDNASKAINWPCNASTRKIRLPLQCAIYGVNPVQIPLAVNAIDNFYSA